MGGYWIVWRNLLYGWWMCVCCVSRILFILLRGYFFLQVTLVLFAWKTLFMKSTQLGSISEMSRTSCGRSSCQWPAMLHIIKWVSSRRWVSLAAEVKESTSLYVSWTRQVRNVTAKSLLFIWLPKNNCTAIKDDFTIQQWPSQSQRKLERIMGCISYQS